MTVHKQSNVRRTLPVESKSNRRRRPNHRPKLRISNSRSAVGRFTSRLVVGGGRDAGQRATGVAVGRSR